MFRNGEKSSSQIREVGSRVFGSFDIVAILLAAP